MYLQIFREIDEWLGIFVRDKVIPKKQIYNYNKIIEEMK